MSQIIGSSGGARKGACSRPEEAVVPSPASLPSITHLKACKRSPGGTRRNPCPEHPDCSIAPPTLPVPAESNHAVGILLSSLTGPMDPTSLHFGNRQGAQGRVLHGSTRGEKRQLWVDSVSLFLQNDRLASAGKPLNCDVLVTKHCIKELWAYTTNGSESAIGAELRRIT